MPRDEPLLSLNDESLALLLELAQVLELGVLTTDRDLVVRNCNGWLRSAADAEVPDLVGRPLLEAFPQLCGGPAEHALRGALAGSTTIWAHRFHKYFLPLPPGTDADSRFDRMQQNARIIPLARDGRIDGVVVLIQDVTERAAREDLLRDALARAEVASQAKSDFLASMSHELRTPLGAIIGFMDLLEGELVGPVQPLQKQYLGRVKAAAKHLVHIIEEILTFSRVEAGKEPIQPEMVDAGAVARNVTELFEPQAVTKQISLSMSIPDGPTMLFTDATKLRQILINVVGNAMKFTETGSVTVVVSATTEKIWFRVCDTGPGMSPQDVERIFDPFTQLDQSLTRSKGGTGLGLPVSRKLAQLLGGDLEVESVVGEGTTFALALPIVAQAAAVLPPPPSAVSVAD